MNKEFIKKYKFSIMIIIVIILIAFFWYQRYYDTYSELTEQISLAEDYKRQFEQYQKLYRDTKSEYNELLQKNSRLSEKNNFFDKYAVICVADGTSLYHSYSCSKKDTSASFMILNIENAKNQGFKPCPVCQSNDFNTEHSSNIVYITNTGSKYHREWCSHLKSKNPIDLEKAQKAGYEPCSKCNP